MENLDLVDEKDRAKLERVRAFVLNRPALFAGRGAVVASWKNWQGKRLGPYYRLAFREDGRQRSLYLGRSEALAEQVRRLLDGLHAPREERLVRKRLLAQARAEVRRVKKDLEREAAAVGIRMKGWEFRGGALRALRARRQGVFEPPD